MSTDRVSTENAFLPLVDLAPMHSEIRAELDAVWRQVSHEHAFILGPHLEAFERQWAQYCQCRAAVGVASGTEAIELGLRALGVGAGDEVIVPAGTFVATAAAVVAAGATPVFTDVDCTSMLITADHVRSAVTQRTAAVVVVHLYGNPADMDPILSAASSAGIAVVEDAAQAHGASIGGRKIGSLGSVGAFSHYPTKNLGAFGDGGSVTTQDEELARTVRLLGNHGRATQSASDYEIVGGTSRLDGLQAAILSTKLSRLDVWNDQRRRIVEWYDDQLPNGIRRVVSGPIEDSAPHLCVVRVADRDGVRARLAEKQIGSGIHYPDPVPRTRAFGHVAGQFPVAERSADSLVSLPLWPGMTQDHVTRVCEALGAESAWSY